jgi:hypothetical protein
MSAPTCTVFQQKKGFEMTNCCDDYGNCNQGRDCPARVAKAKPFMKAADPLPTSMWREQVDRLAYWVLMGILGLMWLALLSAVISCA